MGTIDTFLKSEVESLSAEARKEYEKGCYDPPCDLLYTSGGKRMIGKIVWAIDKYDLDAYCIVAHFDEKYGYAFSLLSRLDDLNVYRDLETAIMNV